jgi:hypothetical protein
MMAKAASERPGTVAEVEAALEAVLSGHELPPPAPRVPVRPWMHGVLATIALAGVAGLIFLGVRGARPLPQATAATTRSAPPAPAPSTSPEAAAPAATPEPERTEVPAPRRSVPTPARAPRPVAVPVELNSTPAGARVTLHGRLLGHTPLSVRLPPDRTLLLVFEAQGRVSIAERVRARSGLVVTAHLPLASVAPGLDDLKASPY